MKNKQTNKQSADKEDSETYKFKAMEIKRQGDHEHRCATYDMIEFRSPGPHMEGVGSPTWRVSKDMRTV